MRAYVSVQPAKNVAGLVDYLEYGRGSMKTGHKENGTDRMAAMYCDAPSPAAFVTEAKRVAKANSRKNEAYSLIVSHPEGRYDETKPESLQEMVRNDVEGARRAYPHSKVLAVAHVDGKGTDGCGGKPHTHLVVMNHDVETGKAITENRTAVKVREIFNELGEELGWEATEVTYDKTLNKSKAHGRAKEVEVDTTTDDAALAATRQRLASLGEFELNLFDDVLKAKEAAQGETHAAWLESFENKLKADGIEMLRAHGRRSPHQKSKQTGVIQGVSYRRVNPTTKRARIVKASNLGEQVKVKALTAASKNYRDELARQKEAEAEAQRLKNTADVPEDIPPLSGLDPALAQMFDAFLEGMDEEEDRKKAAHDEFHTQQHENRAAGVVKKPSTPKTPLKTESAVRETIHETTEQNVETTPEWVRDAHALFDEDEEEFTKLLHNVTPLGKGSLDYALAQHKLDTVRKARTDFDECRENLLDDEARKIAEAYQEQSTDFTSVDKDFEWMGALLESRGAVKEPHKPRVQQAQTVDHAHQETTSKPVKPKVKSKLDERLEQYDSEKKRKAEQREAEAEAEKNKPSSTD